MAKVISLSEKIKPKIKFEKARKGSKLEVSDESQLDLFKDDIKVIDILAIKRPFEIALSLESSDPEKAIEFYNKAIEDGNFPDDANCNLGILFYTRNEADKAIDCFKDALKINPSHFEAHYNIANLYFDMGNYEPAKVHYEIASGLQPEFPNTYYNLGLLLAMDNEIPAAIQALQTYLSLAGENDSKADDLIQRLSNING